MPRLRSEAAPVAMPASAQRDVTVTGSRSSGPKRQATRAFRCSKRSRRSSVKIRCTRSRFRLHPG